VQQIEAFEAAWTRRRRIMVYLTKYRRLKVRVSLEMSIAAALWN